MRSTHDYARIERERRFLLASFPSDAKVVRVRRIVDHYIEGGGLRLRRQSDDGGSIQFKLTQKVPARSTGYQQGFITTMYLSGEEYDLFAQLPATVLQKTRYSIPPFGIDVFEGPLERLILAEAEFDSAEDAEALTIPAFISREVTGDDRFTGGRLIHASREEIRAWLLEYRLDQD